MVNAKLKDPALQDAFFSQTQSGISCNESVDLTGYSE